MSECPVNQRAADGADRMVDILKFLLALRGKDLADVGLLRSQKVDAKVAAECDGAESVGRVVEADEEEWRSQ
ncbi:hypothetical protein D3C87_2161390 [compost metagenome]